MVATDAFSTRKINNTGTKSNYFSPYAGLRIYELAPILYNQASHSSIQPLKFVQIYGANAIANLVAPIQLIARVAIYIYGPRDCI